MREICLDNCRRHCGADRYGVDGHRDLNSGVRSYPGWLSTRPTFVA
jgi:hypothetical protein